MFPKGGTFVWMTGTAAHAQIKRLLVKTISNTGKPRFPSSLANKLIPLLNKVLLVYKVKPSVSSSVPEEASCVPDEAEWTPEELESWSRTLARCTAAAAGKPGAAPGVICAADIRPDEPSAGSTSRKSSLGSDLQPSEGGILLFREPVWGPKLCFAYHRPRLHHAQALRAVNLQARKS